MAVPVTTVPTPGSVRPPALPAATLGVARESFEDLSDEIDMMEVDDFDIVIDESGLDEDAGTATCRRAPISPGTDGRCPGHPPTARRPPP